MVAEFELIDNKERHQYEFHVENRTPRIEYIKTSCGDVYLMRTEVPFGLTGKGIGTRLVEKALKNIRGEGLRLIPLCPFVSVFINKNPEWKQLVIKDASPIEVD
jgi:predicted GNAT family acetyltransferase